MARKESKLTLSAVAVRKCEAPQSLLDVAEDLPEKNTFIDYPPQRMADPPTPTSSAPAFLQRFQKSVDVNDRFMFNETNIDCNTSTECDSDQQDVEESTEEVPGLGKDEAAEIGEVKVSVKNTFIQFDVSAEDENSSEPPLRSAPGDLMKRLFKTNETVPSRQEKQEPDLAQSGLVLDVTADNKAEEAMPQSEGRTLSGAQAHALGQCKPCAYFWYKKDGCRKGEECEFCHLCQKGEIKRRKKNRVQLLKEAGSFIPGFSKRRHAASQKTRSSFSY